MISPSLDAFIEDAAKRRVVSVYTRLVADDLTPVALYSILGQDRDHTYLLESAQSGHWSRYSIVGVRSDATLVERDGKAHWIGKEIVGIDDGDPIEVLRTTLDLLHTPLDDNLPPFHSGMVGYLGYDIVRRLETIDDTNPDDLGVPELVMMLASDLAVLDHHKGEVWLIANAVNFDASKERAEQAYEDACARVRAMCERLLAPRVPLTAQRGPVTPVEIVRQRSGEEYCELVESAKESIRSGDAFQIVVSQRFEAEVSAAPFEVYRALRVTNPSPYLYYFKLPGFAIVGSSPEALVSVKDRIAITRPIAGSRPRGTSPDEDARLAKELRADPKERAEHLMLVDLGRNDLGRVCRPGTVMLREFMGIHRYSHIMHMEAEVSGELAPGITALEVALACFPAGTLSGAPKVSAMSIIDRLEVTRRGIYGGVVGYVDFAGNLDVAIAIRTALLKDGRAFVQAGAGIVADSVATAEDAECQTKAKAVFDAISIAESTHVHRCPLT